MELFISRFLLYLKTRSLGADIEQLMIILPVAIYFDKQVHEEELKCAMEILKERVNPKNLVESVYDRILLRLDDYKKNYEEYILDRQKALEIITNDIQLYTLLQDIFDADGAHDSGEDSLREIIKKRFDEAWELDDAGARMLENQQSDF
ncbi:MAG: hypothetical protein ACTTJS_00050 [Wolinella sp.]